MATTPTPVDIQQQITREDILSAIDALDAGQPHEFGPSVFYDVLHNGKRYPPKAVVGLAAQRLLGRPLVPSEFSGGQESWSFRLLRDRGFEIVQKQGSSRDRILPANPQANIWIETTKTNDHNHGGIGWEFGTCLWSPSTNNAGSDSYALMREIKSGDLVIHIDNGVLVGRSYAEAPYTEVTAAPPEAGPWADRSSYYRIALRDYAQFASPLPVSELFEYGGDRLRTEIQIDHPERYPFILRGPQQELRGAQGAYLSKCTTKLYALIKEQVEARNSKPAESLEEPRFWTISVGEGGRLWNEFQEAGIVAIGWDDFELGDLTRYSSRDELQTALTAQRTTPGPIPTNDALCLYQFSHELSEGDYVIAKLGRRKLLGIGQITSAYFLDPDREEYKHCRRVHWINSQPVDLTNLHTLATKTLTDVTPYQEFVDFVKEAYLQSGTSSATPPVVTQFSEADALQSLFISQTKLKSIIEALRRRKNIILQGPPGVGKTFASRLIAMALMREREHSRMEMVQFHQSYSYEDFIQGWRPRPEGGFRLKNGIFYEFCGRARIDTGRPYVFIIDEINRGNLSRIFGEIMMLMEADKRGAKFSIPLTYSEGDGERFSIPENVHIIGLMNTADRSLAMVDYALRRRFAFFSLEPAFDDSRFIDLLVSNGADRGFVGTFCRKLRTLNEKIATDPDLGHGFLIGHSHFCPTHPDEIPDATWFATIIATEIAPLLREYWFDKKPSELNDLVSDLTTF